MSRTALALRLAAALLVTVPTLSAAQASWELRITSGSLVSPAGKESQFKDAPLTALQVSRVLNQHLAITGTVGWARSRDLGTTDNPKLDVFSTDVGLEARSNEWFATRPVSLTTFAGIGGGARRYHYRSLDVDAANSVAGYVGAGGEVGISRVAVRLEARAYASGFAGLRTSAPSSTRNDVALMGTVRFNRRPAR